MALVARGAKRPTSQYRGMLAPFAPLALSWSGRNDIKNLVRVEWVGGLAPLRGDALLAAFYANELVVRLLARADAHEHLFASYLELLGSLRGERLDAALRDLRTRPAARIGLRRAARSCERRRSDRRAAQYIFRAEAGVHRAVPRGGSRRAASACSGAALLAMARGDFSDTAPPPSEAKRLLRIPDSLPSRRQTAQYATHPARPPRTLNSMTALSVNLNKVALAAQYAHDRHSERLARSGASRSRPVLTASPCIGDPTGRHVRGPDVEELAGPAACVAGMRINIEGTPFHGLLGFRRNRSGLTSALLFRMKSGAFTSDHGWNLPADMPTAWRQPVRQAREARPRG